MPETPPYLNDTLRWIAAEFSFPVADTLTQAVPDTLREHLLASFPIPQDENQLSVSLGPSGPTAQQSQQFRFSRRDRLESVVIGRDTVRLESTNYSGWSAFRNKFLGILNALGDAVRVSGTARVGLRYVDEIRVPSDITGFPDWSEWMDSRLVGPFLLDHEPTPSSGTVLLQYGKAPGYVTVLRAAPVAEGRAVQDNGALLMPFKTPDGPYFLLDTDASWADPSGQVPEFDVPAITDVLNRLHDSCHQLYESSITPKLRADVLNKPRPEVTLDVD